MRKIAVFLVAVVFSICSAGFVSAIIFNGHEYQIIADTGTTWLNARSAAQAIGDGWDLATITSEEEQNFLNTQIPGASSRTQYWIGGYQGPATSEPLENLNWVTGEDWNYTNWDNPPQPDDWMGDQIYLVLDNNSGLWKWDDNNNTLQFTAGYIAERSPVAEPATMFLLGTGLLGLAGIKRKKFQKK